MYKITNTGKSYVARYVGNWLELSGEGPTEAEAIYQLGAARARLTHLLRSQAQEHPKKGGDRSGL